MITYTPEQYSAFWSAVGALATLAAAVVAIMTLLALRRDSQDRTRPVMGAYLQAHPLSHGTSELVVTNYGPTPARDVRVIFDPPLPKLEGAEARGKITPFLEKRYDQVIPTVAPGMKLINVYTVMGDQNDEPVPNSFTISFSYTDMRGRTRYKDAYPLSVETLRNSTSTSPSDKPGGSDIPKRTAKALEAIARGIGRH
ncbi:hypothetical protein [Knoellia koreensis]|uniref:Uncharacterized protein n=1 Tax=Knoellia koreensis TaxID=2730921 RepID=A0A849HEF7_9MICO|nr:hypothetical protein [Knoellia sp. DB2414S]NNM44591.1 hypothetical protein [Knoellia sp. DB2414S]